MSDVKIQPMKNGPLMVQGQVDIVDDAGNVTTVSSAALCRCGHSGKKPMCDGSHRKNNFQS